METEELVQHLSQLELGKDEVRAYLGLLRTGPSKVSVLADATGIHRTKMYRLLDSLGSRNLVTSTLARPTVYRAQPPDRFFSELAERKRLELDEVRKARETLLSPLNQVARAPTEVPGETRWRVIQGRSDILRELRRRTESAEGSVRFLSGPPFVSLDAGPAGSFWDLFAERAEEGVDVQCLVKLSNGPPEPLEAAASPTLQVRSHPHDWDVHFAVLDHELLQWVDVASTTGPTAEDDTALWSTGHGLVESQRHFFENLWAGAQPVG